jgi:hypothetical protein
MRAWPLLFLLTGCPEQVGIITQDPAARGAGQGHPPAPDQPRSGELEEDENVIEPDHPAVKTPQERALVHLHTPVHTCSGMVVGPRLIATAHQCFGPDVKGTFTVPEKDRDAYRVEIASSTLTWTVRRVQSVVTPGCDWKMLDLAIVVLDDVAPTQPVGLATAPSPGAKVQALGFGKCRGDTKPFSGRTGTVVSRRDSELVVDVALCQGDLGGAVFDTGAGGYVGVISHKGDAGPKAVVATSIARFDTQRARDLMAAADAITKGQTSKTAITCD